MNKRKREIIDIPTTKELEQELYKENYKYRYKNLLKSTIYVLVVVIALSILSTTLLFPVLRIYGSSMNPTLVSDDIVLCIKKKDFNKGDVIAFYYNNRILIKRIIATSSDWVDIDEKGNVYVNDKLLEESYIKDKDKGNSDINFPYQVPIETYFLLGDNREVSIDSRNSLIGTVKEEDIVGKVLFKVWPINKLGMIK